MTDAPGHSESTPKLRKKTMDLGRTVDTDVIVGVTFQSSWTY